MFSTKKFLTLLLCFVCFQTANAGWTKQNSGTFAWLHSIYFVNEKKGWIVGSSGAFLTTDNGGETWKQPEKFTKDNILDVYFTDESHGWLLCEGDIYGAGGISPSYLLETADGGANWKKISFNDGKERIAKIFFSKDGYGFAAGEAGSLRAMSDDKTAWKKLPLPVRYLMLDGKFTDNLHGALVGGGSTILLTEDRGLTWNSATVAGQSAAAKLNAIFFINQRIGWTVGGQGKILFTNNGGKIWHEQNSTVSKNLSDIIFINTAEGWAVGDEGTILHTATAGNVWNVEETNIKHKLEKVFFVGGRGFAVGFGGTILTYGKTQNGEPVKKPQLQKRAAV